MARSEELAATIGTAIRRARKDAGLTQQQLAELAELSDRTVREIELGSGTPGLGSVIVVLTVLGLDLTVTS
jgi:y4mF family transcriptional regulator